MVDWSNAAALTHGRGKVLLGANDGNPTGGYGIEEEQECEQR